MKSDYGLQIRSTTTRSSLNHRHSIQTVKTAMQPGVWSESLSGAHVSYCPTRPLQVPRCEIIQSNSHQLPGKRGDKVKGLGQFH